MTEALVVRCLAARMSSDFDDDLNDWSSGLSPTLRQKSLMRSTVPGPRDPDPHPQCRIHLSFFRPRSYPQNLQLSIVDTTQLVIRGY